MAKQQRTRFRFGYKLFVSYLLLVMFPVVGIGLFSYMSSVKVAKEQAHDNVTNTMQQAKDNIIYRLSEIQRISDQIFWDAALQQMLDETMDPYESYVATTSYIEQNLASAMNLTDRSMYISLYFDNERVPEVYTFREAEQRLSDKRYGIYRLNRIAEQSWYRSLPSSDVKPFWQQVGDDEASRQISLLRHIVYFRTLQAGGLLRVTVNLDELFSSISALHVAQNYYALVLDEDGRVLFPIASELKPQPWPVSDSEYLTVSHEIPDTSWQLVALVPLVELESKAREVRNITILLCAASFAVLVVISWLSSKLFSRRVQKLLSSLRAFTDGEFTRRIHYRGSDEFADISAAFNDMAQNIDGLIREVYLSQMKQKEAELAMLQAHINPHFLYNTLSSINQLAKLGKIDQQREMVSGLAKFYRLTLSEGKTVISVRQELEQVKAYIEIQKIKHMDALTISYDIDQSVLGCDTVKLILQPFVENALEHAWCDDQLHIRITVAGEEDRIVYKVIDNGIGMRREAVRQLLQPDSEPLGYGVRNVDERIKLQFGPTYGVNITSRLGMGTTVTIVIPRSGDSLKNHDKSLNVQVAEKAGGSLE